MRGVTHFPARSPLTDNKNRNRDRNLLIVQNRLAQRNSSKLLIIKAIALLLTIFRQKYQKIPQGCSGVRWTFELMLYLENNPSILDSSMASCSFSFLVCKSIPSSLSFSCCKVFILNSCSCCCRFPSALISSVPLKAEINHQRPWPQNKDQKAPLNGGEGEEWEEDGVRVSIKS